MWAIGVVFYTILFGYGPFRGKNEADFFKKIKICEFGFPKSSHPDFEKTPKNN